MTDPTRIYDDQHNNAPAVPQGEPVAWMVYGNYTRQPFGMLSSAEAYMRGLLKTAPCAMCGPVLNGKTPSSQPFAQRGASDERH